jgi:hypothetical protein
MDTDTASQIEQEISAHPVPKRAQLACHRPFSSFLGNSYRLVLGDVQTSRASLLPYSGGNSESDMSHLGSKGPQEE